MLLRRIKFLLQQSHLPLQRVYIALIRLGIQCQRLTLLNLALELVELALLEFELVFERLDFLLLGEELLLESLVLCLGLFSTRKCTVGFSTELGKTLHEIDAFRDNYSIQADSSTPP